MGSRLLGNDDWSASARILVAGDVTEELAGGLDPLAGPEAADYAVHDVQQEADNGLALVGAPADDAGDAGVGGEGWRGERGGQVFECLVARAGAAARRYRVPVGAGTTVSVTGAPAPYGVVAFEPGELGYVFGDEPGCDGVDLLGGFEPVANFKAFVVELAAGDVEVEADDGAPIVGLLAYDVRECGVARSDRCCRVGLFYGSYVLL